MCNIWQHPTKPADEFPPELLEKLPDGLRAINITGGEPALRQDLARIVDILSAKTGRVEISTNGYFTDRLVEAATPHPEITIRISAEGLPETNDRVRGIKNGFDHAMRSYLRLRELGVKDLGFAMTIQDSNKDDLLDLFHLADDLGAEFAQAVPHNSYYFHKFDNQIQDVEGVQAAIKSLIEALLKSKRPKQWARARRFGEGRLLRAERQRHRAGGMLHPRRADGHAPRRHRAPGDDRVREQHPFRGRTGLGAELREAGGPPARRMDASAGVPCGLVVMLDAIP